MGTEVLRAPTCFPFCTVLLAQGPFPSVSAAVALALAPFPSAPGCAVFSGSWLLHWPCTLNLCFCDMCLNCLAVFEVVLGCNLCEECIHDSCEAVSVDLSVSHSVTSWRSCLAVVQFAPGSLSWRSTLTVTRGSSRMLPISILSLSFFFFWILNHSHRKPSKWPSSCS